MAHTVTRLRAVTPLAVGGAKGAEGPAEPYRVPSLRGCLRLWFRAGAGPSSGDVLLQAEQNVFGGGRAGAVVDVWTTDGDGRDQQVKVRMNDTGPTRAARIAGANVAMHAAFRNHVPITKRAAFDGAVELFLLLGGLGGRWRRGFGSLWRVDDGWMNPITGETERERAEWLGRAIRGAVGKISPGGSSGTPILAHGVRILRRGAAKVYVIEPLEGHWNKWSAAMDALRQRYYSEVRTRLNYSSIGRLNPRDPSPLIIQIKPASDRLVGVATVFHDPHFDDKGTAWAKWDAAVSGPFDRLLVTEVTLPS